jgi:hypothetical protein
MNAAPKLRQKAWLLFIPILWWGSSAASGWLNPSFRSPNFEFLEFAVHPARTADYSVDPFTSVFAPIDSSIIDEALKDQGNYAPEVLIPTSGDTAPDNGERDDADREDSDGGINPSNPAPTPEPTTDPGNNGNGNGGGNGNGNGNGNAGGGNGKGGDNRNGNGSDNGNGSGGGSGNGGGNGNDKGKGKDGTG